MKNLKEEKPVEDTLKKGIRDEEDKISDGSF